MWIEPLKNGMSKVRRRVLDFIHIARPSTLTEQVRSYSLPSPGNARSLNLVPETVEPGEQAADCGVCRCAYGGEIVNPWFASQAFHAPRTRLVTFARDIMPVNLGRNCGWCLIRMTPHVENHRILKRRVVDSHRATQMAKRALEVDHLHLPVAAKRHKSETGSRDRLSTLSDEVLLRVLSFLSIAELNICQRYVHGAPIDW
jgi:hypothetical protein